MRHPDLALPTSDLLAWAAGAVEAACPQGRWRRKKPGARMPQGAEPSSHDWSSLNWCLNPCRICYRDWGCLSQQSVHVSILAVDIVLYNVTTGGNWVKKT